MAPIYPVAPGHPDYSSTGTNKFIPQIWSTKLLIKFYLATVFAEIANTDYEGEISKYGDKVLIRTIPTLLIKDYVKGMDLDYENPESPNVELNIDKGKYFAFACDDVDKKQGDIDYVNKWADDGGMQMKIAIDKAILADIYADVAATNKGIAAGAVSSSWNIGVTGNPVSLTKNNVIDYIVDCGTVLAESNIPETDRWFVIPTWMANLIKKSDLKDASLTGDETSSLRNGRLGRIDHFTLYESNNYTSVVDGANTCYHILFGHKAALTFASQMTNMETLRNPKSFGDLIRALNVYGYELIKTDAAGDLYAKKG